MLNSLGKILNFQMPRKGYQNITKRYYRNLNKTIDAYYRHNYIIQTFKIENNYNQQLVQEFDKLTTFLLFNGTSF
jgi:hypothetical protein